MIAFADTAHRTHAAGSRNARLGHTDEPLAAILWIRSLGRKLRDWSRAPRASTAATATSAWKWLLDASGYNTTRRNGRPSEPAAAFMCFPHTTA